MVAARQFRMGVRLQQKVRSRARRSRHARAAAQRFVPFLCRARPRRPARAGVRMPGSEASLDLVAHVIQVALTPIFLLSGIATLLNVFATRLARVADLVA